MFKVYFLLVSEVESESEQDPFLYRGDEALNAARITFPNAVGFVQSRTLKEQDVPAQVSKYSGTLELWFRYAKYALETVSADLTGLLSSETKQKSYLAGMERVVMRLPSHHTEPYIKGIFSFCRKKGMHPKAFQHYWWHNHGPIAALTEEALCYTQIHTLLHCYKDRTPAIDGITELHWSNKDSADRSMQSRQMREDQSTDAANFVDRDSVELFLVKEEVILAP